MFAEDVFGEDASEMRLLTINATSLNEHHGLLNGHLGSKPIICSQCEELFNNAFELRVHMQTVHTTQMEGLICVHNKCGKMFRSKESSRNHERMKHSSLCIDQQRNNVDKQFLCETCGRLFKYKAALAEHKYRHGPQEEYPYICEHCSKRFITLRHYKEHLLRHSNVKEYECPFCGMKKATSRELRIHVNYHTKKRQWKCLLCPGIFNNASNLYTHDRTVHKDIKRYVCQFCKEAFGKPDTLKHHEMRHTGEKPHKCETCAKQFIQIVALRAHLKTHKNGKK